MYFNFLIFLLGIRFQGTRFAELPKPKKSDTSLQESVGQQEPSLSGAQSAGRSGSGAQNTRPPTRDPNTPGAAKSIKSEQGGKDSEDAAR